MMQKLFDHMEQDHGLILTQSELQDIVSAVGMDVRQLLERLLTEKEAFRADNELLRNFVGYVLKYGEKSGISRVVQVARMIEHGTDFTDVLRSMAFDAQHPDAK